MKTTLIAVFLAAAAVAAPGSTKAPTLSSGSSEVSLLPDSKAAKPEVKPTLDCVRRKKGSPAISCRRMTVLDPLKAPGKKSVADVQPLQRFPAGEAVGKDCEPVLCVVPVGEDPNL